MDGTLEIYRGVSPLSRKDERGLAYTSGRSLSLARYFSSYDENQLFKFLNVITLTYTQVELI